MSRRVSLNYQGFYILALFITSCQSIIDIKEENISRTPVVNSFITPDKAWAHLSWSYNFAEDTILPISQDVDITITYLKTGEISRLHKENDFTYAAQNSFEPGEYLLSILIDGFDLISAKTSLPQATEIISGQRIEPSGYDEYGDPYTDYTLTFQDSEINKNYFEVFFAHRAYVAGILDEIWFRSNSCLIMNDPSVSNIGLDNMDSWSLLFNDDLFQGELKQMRIKYCSGDYTSLIEPNSSLQLKTYYAIFRDLSEEYFQFRTSWVKHSYSIPDRPAIFESDPIVDDIIKTLYKPDVQPLYSNVRNAFGVFAGYGEQLFVLQLINPEK